MTALSADRQTTYDAQRLALEIPVAAATTIYLGSLVCRDASGNAVPAADTAGLKLAGVSRGDLRNGASTCDNSAGAAAAKYVEVYRRGVFEFVASGLTKADVGKPVYVADDQTVQLDETNVFAGYLVDFVDSTTAIVDISLATMDTPAAAAGLDFEFVGVAATKSITEGAGVALDADGYLVDMDDSTAVSFWGVALEAVDNSTGADGDLDCAVKRSGKDTFTSSGLAAADVGKEVWQATDASTVSTTPGDILVGVITKYVSATSCVVSYKRMPIVGQRSDRRFQISAAYIGAVGAVGVVAMEDMEFDRKYVVIGGYADAQTAPGGSYFCTIQLDDGTTQYDVVITGSATHGENKTPEPTSPMVVTDTDITLVDDNASGATADVKVRFECEYL